MVAGWFAPRAADVTARYFSWGEIATRKDEGRRKKDEVKSFSSFILHPSSLKSALVCGVICALIFSLFYIPEFWQQVIVAGAVWCAVVISLADLRARIIPDLVLFPFMLGGLLIAPVNPIIAGGYFDAVLTAIFGYVLCAVVDYIFARVRKTRETPIGAGDLKLVAAGGIWLGASGLPIALAAGALAAYFWGRARNARFVPFAPFFFLGAIIAVILTAIM
jgi:prepilin signal peptidase PulO-like enzyme (type II secretory pathway)